MAKVESLTRQLDKQRQGLCGPSSSQSKTHQQLELERLRKELMVRFIVILVVNSNHHHQIILVLMFFVVVLFVCCCCFFFVKQK